MPDIVRDTSISPQRLVTKTPLPNEGTATNLNSHGARLTRLEESVQDFDLIIGTDVQIVEGSADITIEDLEIDLNADSIADNTRILTKDSEGSPWAFTGNVDVQANGIKWYRESQDAILDMATFTFTVSGNDCDMDLIFDNVVSDGIIITGTDGRFNFKTLNALSGETSPISCSTARNKIFWNANMLLTTGIIEFGEGPFIPQTNTTNQIQLYPEDLGSSGGDAALVIRSETGDTWKFGSKMIHSGNIEPTVNNSLDIGTVDLKYATVYATFFDGEATSAVYADLAEKYTIMEGPQPIGTIVSICVEETEAQVQVTHKLYDKSIIGVVSEKPGFLMNKDSTGQSIARIGLVPVRVIGAVRKGDVIVAAGPNHPGVGKYTDPNIDLRNDSKVGFVTETNMDENEKLVMCII